MTLSELLDDVGDRPGHLLTRWREIRDEIHDEHERAITFNERGVLLAIYQVVMDFVETQSSFSPKDLTAFKTARRQDYCLLLAREAVVEGGAVDPVRMEAVTRREVEAGRMAPDDELRKLALEGSVSTVPG
jgi:hypothetical protein